MVDFQERDTKRGLPDPGDDEDEEDAGDDGEVDIDEVRQELEERPDGRDADAGPTDDGADPSGEAGEADAGDGSDLEEGDAGRHEDGDDDGREGDRDGHHDERGQDGHHDHEGAHTHDHDHHAHDVETLGAAVVTVSSSRTMDDDPSGDRVVSALVDAGHDVVTRELIADDYDGIQHTIDTLVRRSDVDVVVTTGGTGVTPDDRTIEAVRPLFEKELPGFGELFRSRSYEEIGTRVVATRATAGIADGVPVFCLPGSTDAVALGVEEIVVEVTPHLAGLARRDADGQPARHRGHPAE